MDNRSQLHCTFYRASYWMPPWLHKKVEHLICVWKVIEGFLSRFRPRTLKWVVVDSSVMFHMIYCTSPIRLSGVSCTCFVWVDVLPVPPPVEPVPLSSEHNYRQYSVQALVMLADLIAPLLDVIYSSEEKDRVVPFLASIMHNVFPYLKNHRWVNSFILNLIL